MFTSLALALIMAPGADGVTTNFVASGAVAKAGGYRPVQCKLSSDSKGVKKAPAGLTSPMYGKLILGKSSVLVILDEPEGKPAKLYVDSNNDGDLSNDAAEWAPRTTNGNTTFFGSANVDIGKSEPVGIKLYRFDPKAQSRAAYKDILLYYADFGYEITLTLDGKSVTSFIAGEPSAATTVQYDRDGNKQISYYKETITVGKPFNYTGTTYVLNVKDGQLSLDTSSEKLPVAPMPPDLSLGKKALPFTAITLDGKSVNFPSDYKGKVVMLDFWATWCGPCIAELPNVRKAYEKWHAAGFEILGVSFDQEDKADLVKKFTAENGMPWRHVYEGKFWNTTQGQQYDVAGIPFCLLVDGDTGEIIATVAKLRGEQIVETIEKALAKKHLTN